MVRADRLVALTLLLRQRGGVVSASTLARELEVTPRTILRDMEALSAAGVPVYAERGRHGGFALLPSFGTELAGLTHEEALALVVAGSARAGQAFGLGTALSSAVRKLVDGMPAARRATLAASAGRLLVDPDADVVVHAKPADEVRPDVLRSLRRAVLEGRQLLLSYCPPGGSTSQRPVDPVGLVTVGGRGYLVALRSGEPRTYRLSRVLEAQVLDEAADRPDDIDLGEVWRERCAAYLHGDDAVSARVVVRRGRTQDLTSTAVAMRVESDALGEDLLLDVTWQDAEHAEFALWRLGVDAHVVEPAWLHELLRDRSAVVAAHYATARPRSP